MPIPISLVGLIPIGPFLAFAAIALWAHRSRALSQVLAITGILVALTTSQIAFWGTVRSRAPYGAAYVDWYVLGTERVRIGVTIDPTSAVVVAMVSLVCLLIFVYSIGYMRHDVHISRFFAYTSLFAGAMLGAVICNNLLMLFVFWEIMGACSYLLIGFWWEKRPAVNAALKAFLVTKIGDLFLMLGLVLIYAQVGSLSFADVFNPDTVARLASTPYLGGISVATVISLLLFGGTIGKSAQLPLNVWLPDAMEGPTPASALIHAATMVSAGVYLLIRAFPLLRASEALPIIAVVGAATALYASVVAIAQNDIKRVLAFSTISQLGYMVAAVGIGAYSAALFHLITHAFFKALLFLAAGSVLHGIEHGHQHTYGHAVPAQAAELEFSPNDMWKMGGLVFRMPLTALSFIAGSLALSGFPLVTAGFWSKDEILAQAWSLDRVIFWVLLASAALTAFYSARQISLTFLGTPRSRAATYTRENRPVMTVPLVILALFAVGLGWLGIPASFPVLGKLFPSWFGPFVDLTLASLGVSVHEPSSAAVAWQPLILGVGCAVGGLALGWLVYARTPVAADPLLKAMRRLHLGWLYQAMEQRFYLDTVYRVLVTRPAVWLAGAFDVVDRRIIDAPIVAFARGFGQSGSLAPSAERFDQRFLDRAVNGIGAFSRMLARLSIRVDDALIDGLVRDVGRIGRTFSGIFGGVGRAVTDGADDGLAGHGRAPSGAFQGIDDGLIDGTVRGIASLTGALGKWSRKMQSGNLPDYLWNAFMIIILLAAVLVLFQRI